MVYEYLLQEAYPEAVRGAWRGRADMRAKGGSTVPTEHLGGQASLAYPAGSDGGTTGMGRINQALTCRNTVLKILEFGLQTQFRNVDNSEFFDGFGASAQVTVLPGFKLAASYTKTLLSEFVEEGFRGLGGTRSMSASELDSTRLSSKSAWSSPIKRTVTWCAVAL
jgi:hypothetical protein